MSCKCICYERDTNDKPLIQSTGPSSFADELAARIKVESVNKPEGDGCKSVIIIIGRLVICVSSSSSLF